MVRVHPPKGVAQVVEQGRKKSRRICNVRRGVPYKLNGMDGTRGREFVGVTMPTEDERKKVLP